MEVLNAKVLLKVSVLTVSFAPCGEMKLDLWYSAPYNFSKTLANLIFLYHLIVVYLLCN